MRGGVAAAVAVLVVGVLELVLEVGGAADAGAGRALRFAAIGVAVSSVAAILVGLAAAAASATPRAALGLAAGHAAAERWRGPFEPLRDDADDRLRALWIHAAAMGLGVFVVGTTVSVHALISTFRNAALAALVCAFAALVWVGIGAVVGLGVAALLRLSPERPATSRFARLRGPRSAIVVWIIVAWMLAAYTAFYWEAFAIVFSVRLALSATVFVLAFLVAATEADALFAFARRFPRVVIGAGSVLLVLTVGTLGWWGGHEDARRMVLRSPTLTLFVDTVHTVSDVDRDGYSSLLNGGDCRPFDGAFHPGARDIPNDGVDQNCNGRDYVPGPRPSPLPDMPMPAALARDDWSILLITIDTLRYDHVGAAGYRRPTTPTIDALAARGAFFERAYSTSFRTWYVVPSIVASQFHGELPFGDRLGPGLPWRLERSPVTFAEVLAAAGYQTALFTAHIYFDGWDVDQGFEHVVNLPEKIGSGKPAAQRLTDRALGWLDRHDAAGRWFAWVHYYEPHFPYESHGFEFGKQAIDRYDEEIRFVDSQLQRIVEWIEADPDRRKRTIVVVTSDHGEAFGEHGAFRHGGGTLWEVLIQVPLVVTVPGAAPQRVTTPASLLDLSPTLAGLIGLAPDEAWTGRAHVAEIAHGINKPDVIVYATDPHRRRYAAITAGWKLLRDERRNVYQLVDLANDPEEESDASSANPEIRARLETAMVQWRERVLDAEVAPIGQGERGTLPE